MKKIGNLLGLLMVVGLLVPVVLAAPASAADPDHVQVTMEGCRLGTFDEATVTCEDDDYTTGNLQPGWNEFDLVPHRLTVTATNAAPATQTYTLSLAFDGEEAGNPGYDRITVPVLNTDLSDPSCTEPTVGAQQTKSPGIGGTDETIYRLVTITQLEGTTCVYDYAGRLAIGASQFPGSSLHANVGDANVNTAGIGARDVSLPVAAIQPQELNKDLSAVQNAAVDWNITKGAEPATIEFGDICNTGDEELTTTVDVTINWDNLGAVADDVVQVTTNVYATNPAHRDITVDVSDTVSSGGNDLYTVTADDVLVPENTTQLVLTDTRTVPAASVVNGQLSNVATASYFDAVFNEPVPGQTTASATAIVQTGTVADETVTITDSESITGTGLMFSVATPSVGAFTGGYVADSKTIGPVGWASGDQTADGSVTFEKTVYLAAGTGSTTGELTDTATLAGDTITKTASADIDITSTASGSVTVNKTTSVPVDEATTFAFEINPGGIPLTVDFAAGDTTGTGSVSGLALGDYTITETDAGGFTPAPDQNFSIALGACDVTLDVDNTFGPATAEVQKVTDPEGFEGEWTFELYLDDTAPVGPNDPNTDRLYSTVTTTDANAISFPEALVDEGDYYIIEVEQDGWENQGGTGECAFTVDYPAHADRLFSCTFTNTANGTITIVKSSGGSPSDTFTFELRELSSDGADPLDPADDVVGLLLDTQDVPIGTPVQLDGDLAIGTYTVCEIVMPGWSTDLPNQYTLNIGLSNERICTDVEITVANQDITLNVNNSPPPGGEQRTIGFWKNWTSCDGNGNQEAILDQTLASAGGILIGDLLVDTCPEAVKILDKRLQNGTKVANDPAMNAASQLLAAKLNVAAGAGTCPAAINAINEAQGILDTLNWLGNAKLTKQQVTQYGAQLNSLAGTLDQYNNGFLC